ncbi:MAG: hypothetical protein ACRDHP_18240 [Ktedonobacterales bacterium]
MKHDTQTERLIPALPPGDFVLHPDEIDRFVARLLPDGTIYFKGTRERIDEFLMACADLGLVVHVDYISLCG